MTIHAVENQVVKYGALNVEEYVLWANCVALTHEKAIPTTIATPTRVLKALTDMPHSLTSGIYEAKLF